MQIVLDASSIIKFSLVWNTKASLGLNKIKKLPNDHPQASEGPDITSAQISTDQPQNWNIDEAPQNSSSQT